MTCREYQIALHAAPIPPGARETVVLRGETYTRLQVVPAVLPSFELSFEDALERFARLPLASVEPDGSVFCRSVPGARFDWHLEGVFYDRAGALLYATFTGNAPWDALLPVVNSLGKPATGVVFQLLQQGIFLDATEFQRWLTG